MIKGFRDFILRGNVVDLAVAVVVGAAFGALVSSFVKNLLDPLIALIAGNKDAGLGRYTLSAGEARFTYGAFLSDAITFLLTAVVIYFVVVAPMKALLERRRQGYAEPPTPTDEVVLLTEIRDLLRGQPAARS